MTERTRSRVWSIQTAQSNLSTSLDIQQIDDILEGDEKMEVPESLQTPLACIFNFVNSTLGSGVLTLPYVFSVAGYILGPIISAFFAILAIISFFMLAKVCDYTQKFQFNTISDRLFKKNAIGILCVIMQIIFIQGALISYVIVLKDNMWFFTDEQDIYKSVVACVLCIFIVMPLSFLKQLKKLKFTSFMIMIVFAYIIVVLIITYSRKRGTEDFTHVVPIKVQISTLFSLSLSIHAYSAQYNFVNLYFELTNRERNCTKVILGNSLIVIITYFLIGFFGYFSYQNLTKPDILQNLERSILAEVAETSLLFFMVCHFPLPVYAMRKGVESLIFKTNEPKYYVSCLISAGIVIISLIVGIFLKSIDSILDFTSTIAGGCLAFIFPGIFSAKVYQLQHNRKFFILSICFTVLGGLIICLAFGVACYKWF